MRPEYLVLRGGGGYHSTTRGLRWAFEVSFWNLVLRRGGWNEWTEGLSCEIGSSDEQWGYLYPRRFLQQVSAEAM
jgi:hypothetical protein